MAILKQTALNITKTGNVLTMTWKLADYYDTQEAYWSIEGRNVVTALSGNDTTVSYTIPVAKYFPLTSKKLASVTIGVRGFVNGKAGAWATSTYKFVVPNKPVVSKESLKFVWETDESYIAGRGDPDVQDVEYQRVNSTTATQNQVKWGTSASSSDFVDVTGAPDSGYVSYSETDKVEWFRCCARGLNGQSAWVYSYHLNAMPYAATDLVSKITSKSVTLTWKTAKSVEHPLDYQQIQYCYAMPTTETDKGVPICPSGVTWIMGEDNIVPNTNKATFEVSQYPPVDQCLFVRIVSVSETNKAYSDPIFVMSGPLATPTLSSIVSDPSTKTTIMTFANNSDVPMSKIVGVTGGGRVLGTAGHSDTTMIVQGIPTDRMQFGIRAFQGIAPTKAKMQSDDVFLATGNVPLAPTNVTAVSTERDGVAEISWEIPWTDAQGAEISWADHDDAWVSTNGPERFEIDQRATWWNVADLVSGVVYYFKVRLKDTSDTYSPYSQMVSLSFASAPGKPVLTSSAVAIQPGESFRLSWTYETTDTTDQALAVIYDNGVELTRVTNNAQSMSVTPAWLFGTSHSLTVRTTSRSGQISEMSDPVSITVAERPTISPIYSAISSGIVNGVLKELPIVMEITGAGEGGQTTIKIERLKDYFVERPDESVTEGYDGEIIYALSYSGEEEITIGPDDLIGSFDDGGEYRITAIVQDSVGQKAEAFLDFAVDWTHQAAKPTATVTINTSTLSATVKATAPSSYVSGDTVDIYRLSSDKPEIIVKGGTYGTTYLDRYPASMGGYRFVDVTANGDYTTANGIAWIDIQHSLELKEVIIDFDNERLELPYNLELNHSWSKDFKETKYLNGHVAGDWNAAVSRTGTISTMLLESDERRDIIRDLAAWSGICHVRTPEGSCFAANIQVNESDSYSTRATRYTFNMTRVDADALEGEEL